MFAVWLEEGIHRKSIDTQGFMEGLSTYAVAALGDDVGDLGRNATWR